MTMKTTELVAPLERRFVGSILHSPRRYLPACLDLVRPEDIAEPVAASIYAVMADAFVEGDDWMSHPRLLMLIGNRCPSHALSMAIKWSAESFNAPSLAADIVEDSRRRALNRALRSALDLAANSEVSAREAAEQVAGDLLALADDGPDDDDSITTAGEEALDALAERGASDGDLVGYSTGIDELDSLIGGLQGGHLGVVAADTSVGKSQLLAGMVRDVCATGGRVGVFSLEMTRAEYFDRLVRLEARVDAGAYQSGNLSTDDMSRVVESADRIMDWQLRIDQRSGITAAQISAKCRRWAVRKPLHLVVVDYIQIVKGEGGRASREREIAAVSCAMKGLAKDLRCCVVLGSQVNKDREKARNRPYRTTDLRESAAPGHDADWVVFIDREERRKDEDGNVLDGGAKRRADPCAARLEAPKVRGRPVGMRQIRWDPDLASFASAFDWGPR